MKNIAIFGAGGFGREVKTILDRINVVTPNTYNFLGFFDDGFEKGSIVNGFPILGGIEDLEPYITFDHGRSTEILQGRMQPNHERI